MKLNVKERISCRLDIFWALPQNSWAGNGQNTLLSQGLTAGNVIAGVGLGLTTAAIALPEVPALAAGVVFTTALGAAWSTYQYSINKT